MIAEAPKAAARKYLAFDIETAKDLAGDFSLWRHHRPLGITCAATCVHDGEPTLWYSTHFDGAPAKRMTQADVQRLVAYLCGMIQQGYTILTWNGASFDFDILAEESGALQECCACVHDHVDMMFHLVCMLGFGVKLSKAAEGLCIPGKYDGMTGADAPKLWALGEYDRVLAYVAQDVRLTLQIADQCERLQEFAWITSKGERNAKPLVGGWQTVRSALTMPLSDISWEPKKAIAREDCLAWMASKTRANAQAGEFLH
jgi:hypothetical protein